MIEVGVYYQSRFFVVGFSDRLALKNAFRCGVFEGCKIDFVNEGLLEHSFDKD